MDTRTRMEKYLIMSPSKSTLFTWGLSAAFAGILAIGGFSMDGYTLMGLIGLAGCVFCGMMICNEKTRESFRSANG